MGPDALTQLAEEKMECQASGFTALYGLESQGIPVGEQD